MIRYYDDLIFSTLSKKKDYFFSQPIFGKSNTDQSFYEPTGSFASNQSKLGASSMTHLHNQAENDIAQVRKDCFFLPQNMTQEELHSYIFNQQEVAQEAINAVNSQINDIKDEVNFAQEIEQKSTDSD